MHDLRPANKSHRRKDRNYEEPYFIPERAKRLKDESITWHDQHKPSCEKVSFDFQIPLDMEVYGTMLLHAALNPLLKRTLENLQQNNKRPGSFQTSTDTINAYIAVGSPAADAYRLMVSHDRKSTIGILKKGNEEGNNRRDEDDPSSEYMQQSRNRRWITALRLYCAIEGHFPHLLKGKWNQLIQHYKSKVSRHVTMDSTLSNACNSCSISQMTIMKAPKAMMKTI